MKLGRAGQATIEGLIMAVPLILLLTAGGFLSLGPLAVFFVEDAMEEALLCATHRPSDDCHREFRRKTERGVLRRWIGTSRLECTPEKCRILVRWTWARPLPAASVRAYPRVVPAPANAVLSSSSFSR